MCGIAGIFGAPDPALLARMQARLRHRGPDGEGSALLGEAALAHTRLSLIDLDGGAEPLWSDDGRRALIYNGEVYNHLELRAQLEREGERFRSRCDAEVVLRVLERWGEAGLAELEGMFALAWTDGVELRLARDPFGIKPLFHALVDGGRSLVFGSEIKALLEDPRVPRGLDRAALFELATFRHVLGDRTLLAGIGQVPPGTVIRIHRGEGGRLALDRRAFGAPRPCAIPDREDDLVDELIARLRRSVAGQLLADHPVGAFLSGGVDSSLLATLAARDSDEPIHTFTIADSADHPDVVMSRRLAEALGTRHHELILPTGELVEQLASTTAIMEAPMEPSIVESGAPILREHVKAVLCGDGADELFAGYLVHAAPQPWVRGCMEAYNRLIRTGQIRSRDCADAKAALASLVSAADMRDAIHQFFLQGQLAYSHLWFWDHGSMASGLEVRVPYLDTRIRDLALSLPWEQRISGDTRKVLLRKAAQRVLPPGLGQEIVGRLKLAAPSALLGAAAALAQLAAEIIPKDHSASHPFSLYCWGPGEMLRLDLFVYLLVGCGGRVPEGFSLRELYTTHRDGLSAALARAAA